MQIIPSFIDKIIDEKIDERINEIIHTERIFKFRKISNREAKNEIKSFILDNKRNNIIHLSTLDFVLSLKLPAEQVEDILEDFEKDKKIKEVYA